MSVPEGPRLPGGRIDIGAAHTDTPRRRARHLLTNYASLARSSLHQIALDALDVAVRAVLPETVVPLHLSFRCGRLEFLGEHHDPGTGKITILGGGKASGGMAAAVEAIVPLTFLSSGVVITNRGYYSTRKTHVLLGGHPVPTRRGVLAARALLRTAAMVPKNGIALCLISGGGSSLLAIPTRDVPLRDFRRISRLLLMCGASVSEVNVVRKHLTQLAGGGLARVLYPARVLTMVMSDTVDVKSDATASGPTMPDPSTYETALSILSRHGLCAETPKSVTTHLRIGANGALADTPKPGDPCFDNVRSCVIADNSTALAAMNRHLVSRGFETHVVPYPIKEEVRGVARRLLQLGRKYLKPTKRICVIAGGESTLSVAGRGRGGRCQHLAGLMLRSLSEMPRTVFLAAGTDGRDFTEGVCGAIVDTHAYGRAADIGLNVERLIARCDSGRLHEGLGTSLRCEDTGTNVCDVFLLASW